MLCWMFVASNCLFACDIIAFLKYSTTKATLGDFIVVDIPEFDCLFSHDEVNLRHFSTPSFCRNIRLWNPSVFQGLLIFVGILYSEAFPRFPWLLTAEPASSFNYEHIVLA